MHANVSHSVAERLGVRSLRRIVVAQSADSFSLGAEAFGQQEALTTRLKHIVDMYGDGNWILYELLQNADDAVSRSLKHAKRLCKNRIFRSKNFLTSLLMKFNYLTVVTWDILDY